MRHVPRTVLQTRKPPRSSVHSFATVSWLEFPFSRELWIVSRVCPSDLCRWFTPSRRLLGILQPDAPPPLANRQAPVGSLEPPMRTPTSSSFITAVQWHCRSVGSASVSHASATPRRSGTSRQSLEHWMGNEATSSNCTSTNCRVNQVHCNSTFHNPALMCLKPTK